MPASLVRTTGKAVLLVLLVSSTAQAAPWLEFASGAAHTGYTTDPGPAVGDIAFNFTTNLARTVLGFPIIIDRDVYLLTATGAFSVPGSRDAIVTLNLDNPAPPEVMVEFDEVPIQWISDGQRIYVFTFSRLEVVDLTTRQIATSVEYPPQGTLTPYGHACALAHLEGTMLYTYCAELGGENGPTCQGGSAIPEFFVEYLVWARCPTEFRTYLTRIDTQNLAAGWEWTRNPHQDVENPTPGTAPTLALIQGFAIIKNKVVAGGVVIDGNECFVAVIDKNTGQRDFKVVHTQYEGRGVAAGTASPCYKVVDPTGSPEQGAEGRAFIKFEGRYPFALALDAPASPDWVWPPPDSSAASDIGAAFTFVPTADRLFVGTGRFIHSLDTESIATDARSNEVAGPGELLAYDIMISTPTHVYARAVDAADFDAKNTFYAVKADTLEVVWSIEVPHHADSVHSYQFLQSVGSGVLVAHGTDGQVMVLGRTEASLGLSAQTETLYPAIGEPWQVELTALDGAFGPAVEYRVDWGDGNRSQWLPGTKFRHTYQENTSSDDPLVARFEARNAQQTVSTALNVFPGVEEPKKPTLADRAFAPDTLPFTIAAGILGIVAIAGLVGVILVRRGVRATGTRLEQITKMLGGKHAQRFEVERELGQGSFGIAQLARDIDLDRRVVLKQPHAQLMAAPGARELFLREAKLSARVEHTNVVRVYEVLPDANPPVLVLEYAPGGSLDDHLRLQGAMGPERGVQTMLEILAGLQAVHEAGIVHRDIKPANVLLDAKGRAKLTDLGVAKVLDPEGTADQTLAIDGSQPGSVAYMSPEQARGGEVDERTDVYAAAALMHRLVTGQHYLEGGAWDIPSLKQRIILEEPTFKHPSFTREVKRVLGKAMAKDRQKRYASARAFATALRKAARADGLLE